MESLFGQHGTSTPDSVQRRGQSELQPPGTPRWSVAVSITETTAVTVEV